MPTPEFKQMIGQRALHKIRQECANKIINMEELEKTKELLKFFVKDTRGDKPWVDADDEWILQNL